jgi:riboflavin synthase
LRQSEPTEEKRGGEMFTGIVEEVGTVKAVQAGRLTISATRVLEGTSPGDSISVNGACLTATDVGGDRFSVDVMPETLRRTNLGALAAGAPVNLERAMAADGRFGGHFVQGHVDETGRIVSVVPEGEAQLMTVGAPPAVMRYVVEKGFIAVDGVSLTVARHDAISFTVSLVAHTLRETTLRHRKAGDTVNLEVDIIAKYVERLKGDATSGVTSRMLEEHGFTTA